MPGAWPPFLIVINAMTRGDARVVEEAKSLPFSWKVPMANTAVKHRLNYINAITTGKTEPEKDREAKAEIDTLWAEVKAAKGRVA